MDITYTFDKIAVIGLGYVGLPLVVEFGKTIPTVGFDISENKVASCSRGIDPSHELSRHAMSQAIHATYTTNERDLSDANVIIVAVPTPVDSSHVPDFQPLIRASEAIGRNIKDGAIVVFESTVYPGATEEICIPVIERVSGKVWKRHFFVGYSPERINPGDGHHTLTSVVKVVSGDCQLTLDKVASLYETIVIPGVHRCSSIMVAEASKIVENTQRDINIALMNELALIFDRVGIETNEVLAAAGTKWNFVKLQPGLVGGHCIGVDPYYLAHKAEKLGYRPEMILAGRRINDGMGQFIANQTIKQMIKAGNPIKGSTVVILGLTFKENCADIRNSKVVDIIDELSSYGVEIIVHDPYADGTESFIEYGVLLCDWDNLPIADAVIAAVPHDYYTTMSRDSIINLMTDFGCFIDVKSAFVSHNIDDSTITVWRL